MTAKDRVSRFAWVTGPWHRHEGVSQRLVRELVREITQDIEDGTLEPGDKLLSIGDACAKLNISSGVIGAAYRFLVDLGLLEVSGRGHRVRGGNSLESPGYDARSRMRRLLEESREELKPKPAFEVKP